MKKFTLGFTLVIAVIFAFSACSKSTKTTSTPVGPATATVNIQNFAFSPASVTIKAGGTVTWTNKDTAPHTVTDVNGTFDSKNLANNDTYARAFPTAGTYTYHCTIHSMMANATVVVTN